MKNINAAIAARILAMVSTGVSPVDALRSVCGAEIVDKMIDDLYLELAR